MDLIVKELYSRYVKSWPNLEKNQSLQFGKYPLHDARAKSQEQINFASETMMAGLSGCTSNKEV